MIQKPSGFKTNLFIDGLRHPLHRVILKSYFQNRSGQGASSRTARIEPRLPRRMSAFAASPSFPKRSAW
jgi:hypothetical protein